MGNADGSVAPTTSTLRPEELPVLYQEDGGESVLRFSEIFLPLRAVAPGKKSKVRAPSSCHVSPHESLASYGTRLLRMRGDAMMAHADARMGFRHQMGREWRLRMARLKAKALPDVEPDVEEPAVDEEAATTSEPSRAVEDENESDSEQDSMSEDDEADRVWAEPGEEDNQPASAFRAAVPLTATTESQEAESIERMAALEPHLAPVHQSDWEDGIVWGGEDSDGEEQQKRPFLGRAHGQAVATSTSTACDVRFKGWEQSGEARRATAASGAGDSWVDKARRGLNPRHLRVERKQVRAPIFGQGQSLLESDPSVFQVSEGGTLMHWIAVFAVCAECGSSSAYNKHR